MALKTWGRPLGESKIGCERKQSLIGASTVPVWDLDGGDSKARLHPLLHPHFKAADRAGFITLEFRLCGLPSDRTDSHGISSTP